MSSASLYVSVLIPLPLEDPEYTYLLDDPDGSGPEGLTGKLCFVPFGKGKTYTGVITSVLGRNAPNNNGVKRYRRILALLAYPPLPGTTLRLWRWVAEYYMCSLGEVFRAAVPAPFRPDGDQRYQVLIQDLVPEKMRAFTLEQSSFSIKELRREFPEDYASLLQQLLEEGAVDLANRPRLFRKEAFLGWGVSPTFLDSKQLQDDVLNTLQRSPKTRKTVEQLISGELPLPSPTTLKDLEKKLHSSSYALSRLRELGVIVELEKSSPSLSHTYGEEGTAANSIHFEEKEILLFHLPFSTIEDRIPIRYLSDALSNAHGQYLLLLPSQEVLDQVEDLLDQAFGERLYPFHSGSTIGNRHQAWLSALQGESGIYVGLRSAVWLPLTNLRQVVIIDEEDMGYRQYEPAPRYTASNVALMLAKYSRAKTVMTSASPSIQSMLYAIQGRYALVTSTKKGLHAPVTTVDMSAAFSQNKVQARMLSFEMTRAIYTALHERKQVLLMYQRKGFAKYIECSSCHSVMECPICRTTYRYYSGKKYSLVCPVCGHYESIPSQCPKCHQSSLQPIGTGVERLAAALRGLYPAVSIGIWDGNNKPAEAQILISTTYTPPLELLQSVGMVGIVQLDLLIMRPDFRANERTYRFLMTCVSEARQASSVVVQYFVQRPTALDALLQENYKTLLDSELKERHVVNFPPFSRQLDVIIQSNSQRDAYRQSQSILLQVQSRLPEIQALGPTPLPSYKKDTDIGYRLSLLIPLQHPLSQVRSLLHGLRKEILSSHRGSTLFIYFDMDPQ